MAIPPPASVRSSVDGCASGRTPGEKASSTAAITAFTAPTSGSFWSITRQMTPEANSEMAMGMKTAVLNATDQRIRSVSTAYMRPNTVTSAGTTAIQSALFRIAVTRMSVVKIVS